MLFARRRINSVRPFRASFFLRKRRPRRRESREKKFKEREEERYGEGGRHEENITRTSERQREKTKKGGSWKGQSDGKSRGKRRATGKTSEFTFPVVRASCVVKYSAFPPPTPPGGLSVATPLFPFPLTGHIIPPAPVHHTLTYFCATMNRADVVVG